MTEKKLNDIILEFDQLALDQYLHQFRSRFRRGIYLPPPRSLIDLVTCAVSNELPDLYESYGKVELAKEIYLRILEFKHFGSFSQG